MINGVAAVPVMTVMMLMASSKAIMGVFTIVGTLRLFGWIATGAMAAAVVAMFWTMVG